MSSPCLADSDCIALTTDSDGALVVDVIVSNDDNNGVECRPGGLWSPRSAVLVEALPAYADSVDGDEVDLLVTDPFSNTFRWRFRYDPSEASDFKWMFVGGPPLGNKRDPAGTINPAGANDWQTLGATDMAGPAINLPVAGYYDITFGAQIDSNADGNVAQVGVTEPTHDPGDSDTASNGNEHGASVMGTLFAFDTDYPSGQLLTLRYRCQGTGGTATFQRRWLKAVPMKAKPG